MSAVPLFRSAFGGEPEAVASAAGRVNLIGEHTDYNGGFVLPVAIPQRTHVALRLGASQAPSQAASAQLDGGSVQTFGATRSSSAVGFADYVKGALWSLREAGYDVPSVNVAVDSEVPIGSGLASSAALLVALLRACSNALGLELSAVATAELAYRAEHDFVGVPIGRMDPNASALASEQTALLLDTRSLAFEQIPLPPEVELAVIDSGLRHTHGTGGYRVRRAECDAAARALGVRLLCELGSSELEKQPGWAALEPTLCARVRHVVSENERVLAAALAMKAGDAVALGRLFDVSHLSLRDDFEVSTPEVDILVESARNLQGCLGARMTGGGFGGAIVALTKAGTAAEVTERALQAYHARVPAVRGSGVVPYGRATAAHVYS